MYCAALPLFLLPPKPIFIYPCIQFDVRICVNVYSHRCMPYTRILYMKYQYVNEKGIKANAGRIKMVTASQWHWNKPKA